MVRLADGQRSLMHYIAPTGRGAFPPRIVILALRHPCSADGPPICLPRLNMAQMGRIPGEVIERTKLINAVLAVRCFC
jgi:hypothetical protein